MFFANQQGVLLYDGQNWKSTLFKSGAPARSINITPDGKVIVGTVADFGILNSTVDGKFSYKSLVPKDSEVSIQRGQIVYEVFSPRAGHFFARTKTGIYELKDGKFSRLSNKNKLKFNVMHILDGQLYVYANKNGVFRYDGKDFVLINGSDKLNTTDSSVYYIGHHDGKLLLITRRSGIFTLSEGNLNKLHFNHPTFSSETIYRARRLRDGRIAIASYNGLFILNKNLNLQRHINETSGLFANNIRSLFEDRDGNLWLGLNNGISTVKLKSPINYFDRKRSKINDRTRNVEIFNKSIYLATSNGIKKSLISNNSLKQYFSAISASHLQTQVWGMKVVGKRLFIASNLGIGFLDKEDNYFQFHNKKMTGNVYSLKKSALFPGHIIIGSAKGAFLIDTSDKKEVFHLNSEKGKTYGVTENPKHREIWFKIIGKGVYRVSFKKTNDGSVNYLSRKFTFKDGLPDKFYRNHNFIEFHDDLLISTKNGTYKYVRKQNKFIIDNLLLANIYSTDERLIANIKLKSGAYWLGFVSLREGRRVVSFKSIDQSMQVKKLPFDQISGNFGFKFYEHGQNVLIVHSEGLAVADQDVATPETFGNALVTGLVVNSTQVYSGAPLQEFSGDFLLPNNYAPNRNRFRFSIAGTDYSDKNKIEFRYRLNESEIYSDWTSNNEITYTNLFPGTYKLSVQAKNKFGKNLKPFTYDFTINPPWWQTTYFYLGEILFFLTLLFFTVLIKQNTRVEKLATALTFVVIIIIFEYVNLLLDPLILEISGGVPVFALISKVILGVMLQPSEKIASRSMDWCSQKLTRNTAEQ